MSMIVWNFAAMGNQARIQDEWRAAQKAADEWRAARKAALEAAAQTLTVGQAFPQLFIDEVSQLQDERGGGSGDMVPQTAEDAAAMGWHRVQFDAREWHWEPPADVRQALGGTYGSTYNGQSIETEPAPDPAACWRCQFYPGGPDHACPMPPDYGTACRVCGLPDALGWLTVNVCHYCAEETGMLDKPFTGKPAPHPLIMFRKRHQPASGPPAYRAWDWQDVTVFLAIWTFAIVFIMAMVA